MLCHKPEADVVIVLHGRGRARYDIDLLHKSGLRPSILPANHPDGQDQPLTTLIIYARIEGDYQSLPIYTYRCDQTK